MSATTDWDIYESEVESLTKEQICDLLEDQQYKWGEPNEDGPVSGATD